MSAMKTRKWSLELAPCPAPSADMTLIGIIGLVITIHRRTWMVHVTLLGFTLSFGQVERWQPPPLPEFCPRGQCPWTGCDCEHASWK